MASITGDTLQEQIQKAILAHGIFKFKLAHMVEAETGEIQPATASVDHHCLVGQWLYALPDDARLSAHCRTVVELHARFHRAAGEVSALSVSRRRSEALLAMEPTSSFKRVSDQLVQALEAWAEAGLESVSAAAEPEAGGAEPGGTGEAARAPEAALPAAEPESKGEELPPGWWLLSPTALAAEAQEVDERGEPDERDERDERDDQTESGRPAEAEEPPESAGSDDKGEMGEISDWFGLPRS